MKRIRFSCLRCRWPAQNLGAQKAGLVYLIEQDAAGASSAGAKDAPTWGDAGTKGWAVSALVDAGVDFYIFKAAPGAPMAIHKSDVEWIAYVLEGNGQLLLADAAGKQTGTSRRATTWFSAPTPCTAGGRDG
jgi:hypothetical protein